MITTNLNSYRLDGTVMPYTTDGSKIVSNLNYTSWHSIEQGNNFRWWINTTNNGNLVLVHNRTRYISYNIINHKYLADINSPIVSPILPYLETFEQYRVPFSIKTFVQYPTIIMDPYPVATQLPIPSYLSTVIDNLTVIAGRNIDGYATYEMIQSTASLPEGYNFPNHIWFAIIHNQFIPIKFQQADPIQQTGAMKYTLTITDGKVIDNVWLPTSYTLTNKIAGYKLVHGKKINYSWNPGVFPYYHYFINISGVNKQYGQEQFTLSLPDDTVITKDGILIPKTQNGLFTNNFTNGHHVFFICISIFLIIFVYYTISFTRKKK